MKKELFDLKEEDLNNYPIWYFPMNEDEEYGDTIIKPVDNKEFLDLDYQIIVKTTFEDKKRNKFIGFISWGVPEGIEYIQPTIINGENYISFWNGIRKPEINEEKLFKRIFNYESLPIKFVSENVMGLKSISGTLEGLYYYDEEYNIKHVF